PLRQSEQYLGRNLALEQCIGEFGGDVRVESVDALGVAPGADGGESGHVVDAVQAEPVSSSVGADDGVPSGHWQKAPARPFGEVRASRGAEFINGFPGRRIHPASHVQMIKWANHLALSK